MKNKNGAIGILIVIIIGLLLYIILKPREVTAPIDQTASGQTTTSNNPNGADYTPPAITTFGKAQPTDLISFSIAPGQTVSGKITATGKIKGGYFFEGNILTSIVAADKTILRAGHGQSTSDWMTAGPVSFTTSLDFVGLPKGAAFISIHNDNPSDMRENDKGILIPIVIN